MEIAITTQYLGEHFIEIFPLLLKNNFSHKYFVPVLGKLRQNYCKLVASFSYMARSCLRNK
jgi:hypothetical protein